MGTSVHLVVSSPDLRQQCKLLDAGQTLIHQAEQRWSRFRTDSELSQINRSAGHVTVVSAATFDLLDLALHAWAATGGAFDPTLGALLCQAGYDDDFRHLVDGDVRAAVRRPPVYDTPGQAAMGPGPDQVECHRPTRTVTLPSGTALDFGGIAKGYVADTVAERLLALGAGGCCVNIGGDVRVAGTGPEGGAWIVELTFPGTDGRQLVRLRSGGVCTSSTTKRRWQTPEGPAHHLIDPRTGQSRLGGPTTVTSIAATATAAEVITKWMMAGGLPDRFGATGLSMPADGSVVHHHGLDPFLVSAAGLNGRGTTQIEGVAG